MSKNYTKYTEKEWEDIRKDYIDNNLSHKDVQVKYSTTKGYTSKYLKSDKSGRKPKDLTNQIFGKLKVLSLIESNGTKKYKCLCSCGNEKDIAHTSLVSGRTKSCGKCLHKNKERKNTITYRHKPTYGSWLCMKQRCYNKTNHVYPYYGGRGITVCERWLDKKKGYTNFLMDMGERPDGKTIDRTNVNGNYEPGNCTWATPKEQSNNQQRHVKNPE